MGNAKQSSLVPKLEEDKAIVQKALEVAETMVTEALAKKEVVDSEEFKVGSSKQANQSLLNASMKANPFEARHEEKVCEA